MKKFIVLFTAILLLISFGYYRYNHRRIKKTKGSIVIFKSSTNDSYYLKDKNDIKSIVSVINNSKKIWTSYAEVEKEYDVLYEIIVQQYNGYKSIFVLWADGDKYVITEESNGTMIVSSEDTLRLKDLLKKLDGN